MINTLKNTIVFIFITLSASVFAQTEPEKGTGSTEAVAAVQNNAPPVEMADSLAQSGKIYVVVTVLSVIFIGIIVYLISIDRKISKLEKEEKK